MTRWISRLSLALLLCGLMAAAACGGGGGGNKTGQQTFNDDPTPIAVATTAAFPVTIQRSDGKPLTLTKPPTRIVSLSPGATEIIYAIGAQSSLVAVDKQADYPDAAKNFAEKVDAFEPNVETIAGLTPDLVIVATDTNGIVGKLDGLNIPVLFEDIDTSVKTVDDVFGQMRIIGQVTGRTDEAVDLINGLAGRVQIIKDALNGTNQSNNPSIYHELDSTYYTASSSGFIGDLYRILRVRNIAGDGRGAPYPQLTAETIIASNPQVIILADEEFGVSIDSVKARPGWDAIDAVKNNKIFAVDPDIISRPGPRVVEALEQLAKDIYPERFE
jgi:iron complex transport system substrate-binding protein